MKEFITTEGRGTRLRPLTHTSNKHLIFLVNKPMIYYALESVIRAGINDIGILINPETVDEIKEALGDGAKWGG